MMHRGSFIERSIMGALSFLKESVFSDEYASRKAFMQSVDPRIKAVIVALFLLDVLLTRSIIVCLCLYALCMLLARISDIELGFFLRRTWIFIPLFSLFIAVPALFSIFTPGEAVVAWSAFGIHFAITRQGVLGASLFVARVVTSVSFAVLLSITTKHFALLKALRVFKVPQLFVMVLGMCYRYIYLLVETIEWTYRAIKSRVGTEVRYAKGQHLVGSNIAALWYRSYQLNEAVYHAMCSRGYGGEPVVTDDFKARPKDWVWLSVAVVLFFASLYFGTHARY